MYGGYGRIASEIDVKYVGNQNTACGNFTIAVSRGRKDKDGKEITDFHKCQVWGKLCETMERYCKKGDRIVVEGDIWNNNYEKDGVKHYGYVVNVAQVKFVETKKDRENQSEDDFVPAPPPAQATMDEEFVQVPENVKGDIPFFND